MKITKEEKELTIESLNNLCKRKLNEASLFFQEASNSDEDLISERYRESGMCALIDHRRIIDLIEKVQKQKAL